MGVGGGALLRAPILAPGVPSSSRCGFSNGTDEQSQAGTRLLSPVCTAEPGKGALECGGASQPAGFRLPSLG